MIDFKVLVKVNPEDSKAAVRKLGEKVLNDETAFASVDPVWVRKQDYITVLPVPDTKFIVTGVTSENVDSLINEFGYKVYPAYTVQASVPAPEEKDSNENPSMVKDALDQVSPINHQIKYWINGEEVPQEKWEEKKEDFIKAWNEVWGDFGRKMWNF